MSRRSVFTALAGFFMAVMLVSSIAWANLMVMPPRIIFKDGDRMKTLTVANVSPEDATYRLSFYHQKQLENGTYQPVETPVNPEFDLSKMLVFSPRQVQLEAGGKQGVRLSLRRPENLPDGEYRVHVKVARYFPEEERRVAKGQAAVIGVNIGFAVPVILRKGKYDTTAKISDAKYVARNNAAKRPQPPKVEFYINRTGKYSALGNALVFWKGPNGQEEQVGVLNKVNVFPEVGKRLVSVNLTKDISGGTLRVRYDGDDADKGILFDEITFPAP